MQRGPVDFILAEFRDGSFHGGMAAALADLIDRDLVRILDLVFIAKDADGAVDTFELDSLGTDETASYDALEGEVGGLLSESDLEAAAAELEPGAAAGLIVYENLWARGFLQALHEAGGKVVSQARIPADEIDRAFEDLESA